MEILVDGLTWCDLCFIVLHSFLGALIGTDVVDFFQLAHNTDWRLLRKQIIWHQPNQCINYQGLENYPNHPQHVCLPPLYWVPFDDPCQKHLTFLLFYQNVPIKTTLHGRKAYPTFKKWKLIDSKMPSENMDLLVSRNIPMLVTSL